MVYGHQVMPRLRQSYNYSEVKTRKPYCLDCGGLPMLSAYIRKGAGGPQHYVIGYYCEFCAGFIAEIDWLPHQDGTYEGHALWSFSEKQPYKWMTIAEFKEKMRELRLKKLKELEDFKYRCEVDDPDLIPYVLDHISALKRLLRIKD